jgi:hypothetical protein
MQGARHQYKIRTLCDTVPTHWIQLPDLAVAASLTSGIEHFLRHVCLDQARADRVYANVGLL